MQCKVDVLITLKEKVDDLADKNIKVCGHPFLHGLILYSYTYNYMTDSIINVGQMLLHVQHGTSGLQHTGLGRTLNFQAMEGEFVQVLHSGGTTG